MADDGIKLSFSDEQIELMIVSSIIYLSIFACDIFILYKLFSSSKEKITTGVKTFLYALGVLSTLILPFILYVLVFFILIINFDGKVFLNLNHDTLDIIIVILFFVFIVEKLLLLILVIYSIMNIRKKRKNSMNYQPLRKRLGNGFQYSGFV